MPESKIVCCDDCGKPYSEFGLDTTLPNNQWSDITMDGATLLCTNCMVIRASKLPHVIAARMVIDIAWPPIKPRNKVMPVRIQRKRTKGYDMQRESPNGLPVVYVGRNSKWGNPYRVGDLSHDDPPQSLTIKECIELFEYYTVPEHHG